MKLPMSGPFLFFAFSTGRHAQKCQPNPGLQVSVAVGPAQ